MFLYLYVRARAGIKISTYARGNLLPGVHGPSVPTKYVHMCRAKRAACWVCNACLDHEYLLNTCTCLGRNMLLGLQCVPGSWVASNYLQVCVGQNVLLG